MGTDKRQRQKEGRQARIAAAEMAKRKADRRRRIITIAISVVVVIGGVLAINHFTKKSSSTNVAATATSVPDSSSTTLPSASGQPCVAVSDPLPAGAPNVPVQVGPAPTTLVSQDLKVGTGAEVTAGDTVTVNYIGVACSTGKIFDSSYSRGQTATFPLDQVIKGWTNGIPGMKVGGQRLLGIPADQAYGASPPPGINPDEALWFVVDVTDTVKASATTTTTAVGTPSSSTPASSVPSSTTTVAP